MKRNALTLIVGVVLLIIFCLLLFVFQVRRSEVVVVTTFGQPTRTITNAGPHLRLPWPIMTVHRFDQRVQNFEDKLSEGQTLDKFNLLTSVYVGWKITEATNFFPKFAGGSEPIAAAESNLERLLGNAKTAVVGKHPLAHFVSATDNGTNFVAIEQEILANLQSQVKSQNYGLQIEFLGIKRLQIPESVTQQVFESMTAERKVLSDSLQAQGESDAANIRSDAERKAAEMRSEADAQATRIRGEAEAEAAKSLAVFQQNPELANFLFRLSALEGSLKERSVLIFDQNMPPFDLFRAGAGTPLNK
jgi:membrane protease subunit HflC